MCWKFINYCAMLYIVCVLSDSKTVDNAEDADGEDEIFDTYVDRDADILKPYLHHHGPTHHHRVVRDCQPSAYGNITYEEVAPHRSSSLKSPQPVVNYKDFVYKVNEYWNEFYAYGHHITVADPDRTVSVLEPSRIGGCQDHLRATVAESARHSGCIVAINAGFFNTTSGACYGDVMSDDKLVQNSGGVQNAHFGIETDGSLFFGYLPPDVMLKESFNQLVGGVLWLVRDGRNYVDVSKEAECSDSQETGNLQTFIDVHSARVAVGHDQHGKLVIVAIEGRSWERGLTLYQFADLLISLGVVNAINFDGGGSTTVVVNGTLVNYPGDRCNISNFEYSCEREVSTILCVHDIRCVPTDCSNHGDCYHGHCDCHDYWGGSGCDTLSCGVANCSNNGECTEVGCLCFPGYQGRDCLRQCSLGYYGDQCSHECNCSHGELCDAATGSCFCNPGYMGYQCETSCPYGFYGVDCEGECSCVDGCSCHPITGHCHLSPSIPTVWQIGHCVADKVIISRDLMPVDPEQYYLLLSSLVGLSILALGSIILNVVLLSQKLAQPQSSASKSLPAKTKPKPRNCLKPTAVVSSNSPDRINNHVCHNDADIESSYDSEPTSFLSKLSFGKKRKQQRKEMWKNWHNKFRRKKNGYCELGQTDDLPIDACNDSSTFTSQPLSPITCDTPPPGSDSDIPNTLDSTEKQRKGSGHTEELLDEISLELSSPERVVRSNHTGDSLLAASPATTLSQSQARPNHVFHPTDETVL